MQLRRVPGTPSYIPLISGILSCAINVVDDLTLLLNDININSYRRQGKCVVCGSPGVADAFYCVECTILEKDREGCPKIINVGTAKIDLVYEKKKYKR